MQAIARTAVGLVTTRLYNESGVVDNPE